MDRKVVIVVAVAAVLGLALFFRYEVTPAGNSGGIYKTDRWTGDTTFIRGGTAVQAQEKPSAIEQFLGPAEGQQR